jgi:DNA-binding NarL/FixJ family response regulator
MQLLKTYIIEDSKMIRDNLIAALEEITPVEVVGVAEDEDTAVRWLTETSNDADLVIIDIFLKLGSGLAVLRATRTQNKQSKRTTIVLSNHATPEIRLRCAQLGANKVFDKSNELDALMLYCMRLASGDAGNSTNGEFS